MIYGRGLKAKDANIKPEDWAKLQSMMRPKDLKRAILDRKMLGMGALQVTYKKNKPFKVTHFPMNTLRAEKADKNGEINQWYYSNNWEEVVENTKLKSFPAAVTSFPIAMPYESVALTFAF